jgi:hypothetical protein
MWEADDCAEQDEQEGDDENVSMHGAWSAKIGLYFKELA